MRKLIYMLLTLILGVVSCQQDTSGQYVYHQPDQVDDGLETASLYDVNMDTEPISDAVR